MVSTRRLAWTLRLAAVFELSSAGSARAAVSDAAFSETTLLAPNGQAGTTAMAWAPDGSNRLFFTRQTGRLNVVQNGQLLPVANITPIYNDSECGVLSLAFDPRFAVNHFVYLFVTPSPTEQQIIRYTLDGNVASDKTVIVSGLPTRGQNHDAGSIGFGPDGKLYWAIGDLGNGTGTQGDLSTTAAKISRVNPDGSAPEDNPFFDGAGPNDDRIWARGFRNPFTFTWRPSTDELWVDAVGAVYEQVFVVSGGDDAGWNAYENNQPKPLIQPLLAYATGSNISAAILADGASRTAGVATFTTTTDHRLHVGARVTLSGVADSSFNGSGLVSAVPSARAFSILQVGADASSGGGLGTPVDIGNAITGGTFWDSNSVPLDYRGNFFFGDYASGKIARVAFGPEGRVASFDEWGSTGAHMIDLAVGPDGDLYYATFEGGFYRIHFEAKAQAIVTSHLNLRIPEAGQGVFSVHLAMAPVEPMVVAIEPTASDGDIATKEAQLTFEASNWDVPQPVHVSASNDADADDDVAGIVLRASGVADALVAIRVTDDDPLAILVSKSELSLAVGSSEELSVVLNGRPRLPVAASIVSDDVDAVSVAPSTLRFEPDDWNKPSSIVISARPGSSADSFATVTLAARGFEPARVKVTSRALGAGGEAGGSMTDSSGGAAGGPADAGALGSGGVTEAGGGVTEAGGEAPSGGAPTAPAASIDTSGCGCRYSPQSVPAGLVALLGAAALLARRPRRVLKVCHRRAST